MRKRKRIGILGGTFNPPHLGHLVLAEESVRKLKLDKLIFIPTRISPHKKIGYNNAYMRYRMVALACTGNPRFKASSIELERKGVSYSVDTLRKLKSIYGKRAELFFIAGSDSLKELESWKNIDEVLKIVNFVVAVRPGFPVRKLKRKVKFIAIPAIDVSSSMVRSRVQLSQSIRYLVPESIRNFIVVHKLYR